MSAAGWSQSIDVNHDDLCKIRQILQVIIRVQGKQEEILEKIEKMTL